MICRDCGNDNRSGRVYCEKCSGRLFRKHLDDMM
jgi:DNA-directed RNA polymerase subunit RPC12/RpoP